MVVLSLLTVSEDCSMRVFWTGVILGHLVSGDLFDPGG